MTVTDMDELLASDHDVWAVACNYRLATKVARLGALAYVEAGGGGMGYERLPVMVRSRGGKWVRKWEDIRRLTNFRAKCLPKRHPIRSRGRWSVEFHPGRVAAEDHAATLTLCSRREATARGHGSTEGNSRVNSERCSRSCREESDDCASDPMRLRPRPARP